MMDIQEYLLNLIVRMQDDTLEYVPEKHGSMYVIKDSAYEEARSLNNSLYIQPLMELVDQYASSKMNDKDVRRKIYFMLESIAVNTGSDEVFEYFAERLSQETDKYLLGDSLLLFLRRNSYVPNLKKILPLVEDNRWQVRYEVVSILGNYPKNEVEDILLKLLEQAKDAYEIGYLLGSLRRIGSTKVLDVIEKYLNHEKGEIRASAIATLNHLGGKPYLPIFVTALKDRSLEVKLNALYAVIQHGDITVIQPLIERIKAMVKTKRKISPATPKDSDVITIVTFLLSYKDHDDVISTLNWIQQKKWDNLFENEQNWFKQNVQL